MDHPMTIGKNSNNETFAVDLKELPNLFICYSDPLHLQDYLKALLQEVTTAGKMDSIHFNLSLNRMNWQVLKSIIPEESIRGLLVKFEPEMSSILGKEAFIKLLMKEFLQRKKNYRKLSAPLVVVADDILDLVITRKKYTGEYFIQLLNEGCQYNIYFIIATIRTYRNLMTQLQQEMNNCAELIINPEHFFYFKKRDTITYSRFYPMKEKPGSA
jgi:hypothetical protein